MKIVTLLAAALVSLTGVAAAAPAAAQDRVVVRERVYAPGVDNRRVVVRERTTTTRRSNYRRSQPRRVCTVRYRNGDRVRTCRTIYRRRY